MMDKVVNPGIHPDTTLHDWAKRQSVPSAGRLEAGRLARLSVARMVGMTPTSLMTHYGSTQETCSCARNVAERVAPGSALSVMAQENSN